MSRWVKITAWAATVAGAAVLAASAQSAEYKWRMTTPVAENSIPYVEFVKRFVEEAKILTDGQVQITAYGAGVIAPAFKAYDAVQDGLVETALTSPTYLTNKDPVNALIGTSPMGMPSMQFLHWIYYGGAKEMWDEFRIKEMGLKSLLTGMHGSELFAHSRKPLRTAADFKGLKHRTSGANAWVVQKLGATPIVAAQAELFGLLEKGVIDSAEFQTPAMNLPDGYHEVAKYIIVPGVHNPCSMWEVVMKKERWDALPADIKAKLEAAAMLTSVKAVLKIGVDDMAALQKYRDNKNEFVTMDPALVQQFKDLGLEWANTMAAEQKAKGNLWMEKFVASYMDFRKKWAENAVHQVKE